MSAPRTSPPCHLATELFGGLCCSAVVELVAKVETVFFNNTCLAYPYPVFAD